MDQSYQHEENEKVSVDPLNPLLGIAKETAMSGDHGQQQNLEVSEMPALSNPTEGTNHGETAISAEHEPQQNLEVSEMPVYSNPTEVTNHEERPMSVEFEPQQNLEVSEMPVYSNPTGVTHHEETGMLVKHEQQQSQEVSEIPVYSNPIEISHHVRDEQCIEQQLVKSCNPSLPQTGQQEMEIPEQLPSQIALTEICQQPSSTTDQQEMKVCEPLSQKVCEPLSSQTVNQEVAQLDHSRVQESQPIDGQQSDSLSQRQDCTQVETATPKVQLKVAVSAAHLSDEVKEDRNQKESLQKCGKHQQEDSRVSSMVTNGCENQIMGTGLSGGMHSEVNGSNKQEMERQPEEQTPMQNFSHCVEDETKMLQTNIQEKHKHGREKMEDNQKKQNGLDKSKANASDKNQGKQKQEQQTKKQKTAVVGENYERINYLVQTSRVLVARGISNEEQGPLEFDRALASQTGSLAAAVGRRCLIRLTPSLKRMMCKGCGTSLIYGVNARVRHRSNRQGHLVITCLTCSSIKRIVCDPKHRLWCDNEEALL